MGSCLWSVHLMSYLKPFCNADLTERSSVVLFIESQEVFFFFFFFFPFIFLLMAMTVLKPWTSQTGWTAAPWNMDNFGESENWVSLTSDCLGERARMLCIGSCAWWKIRLLLHCLFCQCKRENLLNFKLFWWNGFFVGFFFFLILFYHWQRWRN